MQTIFKRNKRPHPHSEAVQPRTMPSPSTQPQESHTPQTISTGNQLEQLVKEGKSVIGEMKDTLQKIEHAKERANGPKNHQ